MKKMLDIEIMRIVAIFLVIFVHTYEKGILLFSLYEPGDIRYFMYLPMSVCCSSGVPIFFMISGALILNKTNGTINDIKKIWTKKIPHMLLVLFVWSIIHYIPVLHINANYRFDFLGFLKAFYTSDNIYAHLWFLYAYIAYLMTLPILKKIANALTNVEYLYLFTLVLVFSMIVPTIDYLISYGKIAMNSNIKPSWIGNVIFICPLIGYFLKCRIENFWTKKKILILWVVNIFTIMISCYMSYLQAKNTEVHNEIHSLFSYVNAVTIFVSIQYFVKKVKCIEHLRVPLTKIGSSIFFIYLVNIKLLSFNQRFLMGGFYKYFSEFFPMTYAFLWCIMVMVVGFILFQIVSRIPIVRKLVVSS